MSRITTNSASVSTPDNLLTIKDLGLHDFETKNYCRRQNDAMLARLKRNSASESDIPLGDVDGNWLAFRKYRRSLIPQACELLRQHGDPIYFVTVSHPLWQREIGELDELSRSAVKQWIDRRLEDFDKSIVVVGGLEASIGVSIAGNCRWDGHVHLVISGLTRKELTDAFRLEDHYREEKYLRPVVIEPVGNLARRVAYSMKRIGIRRIAYRGTNGRQQRRKLPLTTEWQLEFDQWLLSIPIGGRTILLGCRLHGSQLRATRQTLSTAATKQQNCI